MMRLLATLATAGLVVWAANQAAERVDPELWRAGGRADPPAPRLQSKM